MKHLFAFLATLAIAFGISVAQTAEDYISQAHEKEQANAYDEAIALYQKGLEVSPTPSDDAARCLHCLGRAYFSLGDIDTGRKYTIDAMNMREQLHGRESFEYLTSFNNYAISYFMVGDYAQALKLGEEMMTLSEKASDLPQADLGLWHTNLGRYYYMAQDLANAANEWECALPLVEKFSDEYEMLLNFLGNIYSETNDQENLMRIFALFEEHNQHELQKPCDDFPCKLERAKYYAAVGELDQASELFRQLLKMDATDEQKAEGYKEYSNYLYSMRNDYKGAMENALLAATYCSGIPCANLKYRAALFGFIGKEYESSIQAYQEAIQIFSNSDEEDAAKKIIDCKRGIVNDYLALRQPENALGYANEVTAYYQATNPNSKEYGDALVQRAQTYKQLSSYDEALEDYKSAMEVYQAIGEDEKYAETANSYSLCCAYAHKESDISYDEAARKRRNDEKVRTIIQQEIANLDLYKQYFNPLTYSSALGTIAGAYSQLEEYDNSISFYLQYTEALNNALRTEFKLKSPSERATLWPNQSTYIEEMLEMYVDFDGNMVSGLDALDPVAYNALLLKKGILLNSSIEFEKVVAKSSPDAQTLYSKIKSKLKEEERLRNTASTDADLDKILELKREIEDLQLQLYSKCSEVADYTDYMGRTFKDVQDKLDNGDVAIEFAQIAPNIFDNENLIVAFVIAKGMKAPKAVKIADLKTLKDGFSQENVYSDPIVGQSMWGPLATYLEGAKRIYFSPDGILNQLGVEYLTYGSQNLSKAYKVYRLSSTKSLCQATNKSKIKDITLIGGIDYTDDTPTTQSLSDFLAEAGSVTSPSKAMGSISVDDYGMFDDLPYSKTSIADIYNLTTSSSLKPNVNLLYNSMPTHSAFVSLSGQPIQILHIATHGIASDSKSETESMQNCKLALAGANLYSMSRDVDGYVSAAEIAEMDLRNCDLAVLSACETAAGTISDDGVFGLQRGFKNAGVKTLMMSLNPVYDSATAKMMTLFYHNLVSGMSTLDALNQAQAEMEKSSGVTVKDWASFILLDAID